MYTCTCTSLCMCLHVSSFDSLSGKEEAIVLAGQLSDNIQRMSTSRGVSNT